MLELLQSNKMSALVSTFCQRNANPRGAPFQPVTVAVQSFGIGQWLKHELAKQTGIAANIECILPAELIWRFYQSALPQQQLNESSPFSLTHLTWRIMQLLPLQTSDDFKAITQYLAGDGDQQLRLYQLSNNIAGLFDQYLIYRPDWIKAWEKGTDSITYAWQSQLWRALIKMPDMDPAHHRASLHFDFMQSVNMKATALPQLPATISIFGLSALPVIHLEALQAVSTLTNVDIYFLNPCQHYWGDIVSEKDITKRSIRKILDTQTPLIDDDYLEVGNPLLSSMGKQGREFLELILNMESIQIQEHFEPANAQNALKEIQDDILNLEYGGEYVGELKGTQERDKKARKKHDKSLQIHSTHSRHREVEILYDQILGMIDNGIQPNEVIVMAPNISQYAPFINAVFRRKLQYSITDQALSDTSSISTVFQTLLKLPDLRFSASEIMGLLEVPAIAAKLALDPNEFERLIYWVNEAAIRWEVDGFSKQHYWQLPASDHNTWLFGLRRLLLGFAVQDQIIDGIAPLKVSANDASLIALLYGFIESLANYRHQLSLEHTPEQWQSLMTGLLNEFFLTDIEDELCVNFIRDACIQITEQTQCTLYPEALSAKLYRYLLEEKLANQSQGHNFISGGITFATLIPMRSIPFKAVCLIGMNDKEFPRQDRMSSFDLMASDYRKGDRSKRQDDRYLFLEALLSAQEVFYLSYQGRSIQDNKIKPPSVLINEICDYLAGIYIDDFTIEHPLQPFNEKYYNQIEIKSYNKMWYEALLNATDASANNEVDFVDKALKPKNEVNLTITSLCQFIRHPAKFFLATRLGIYLEQNESVLKDIESFQLDGLERYQLSEKALSTLLKGESIEKLEMQTKAEGLILPGMMGDAYLHQELTKATVMHATLTPLIAYPAIELTGTITICEHTFSESFVSYNDQFLNYRVGTLRKRQLLEIWVKHLFANAMGFNQNTLLVSKSTSSANNKASQSQLLALEPETAKAFLSTIIDIFQSHQDLPLHFLPEASFAYITAITKRTKKTADLTDHDLHIAAKNKAEQSFHQMNGEGSDPYYARLFNFPAAMNHDFESTAELIYAPLQAHWETVK